MGERIRANDIPTREPDVFCEEHGDYYALKIWADENVVAFRDSNRRSEWTHYDGIDCGSVNDAVQYLEFLAKEHSHPHHKNVVDYLEHILLGESCGLADI
jgi:hypothetical protein